jgi:hypothetical protein
MGVNWADIGAAGRGAADAYYRYRDEENKAADAKFKKKQRGREEKKWDQEDKVEAMESNVQGTGTFEETAPNDPYGEHVTGKKVVRGIADVQKDRAAGFQKLGLGDRAAQATVQADQFGEIEHKNAVRAKQQAALKAHEARIKALQSGDFSAVPELVNRYNADLKDGKDMAYGRGAAGHHLTRLDAKTGKVIESQTLTDQQIMELAIGGSKMLLDHEMSVIDAAGYNQSFERGIKGREIGVKEGALDVSRGDLALKQLLGGSTQTYQDRLGRAALTQAGASAARVAQDSNSAQPGKVLFNTETKQYEIHTPVVNRSTGKITYNTQPLDPRLVPQKQVTERSPEEMAAVKAVGDMIKNGVVDPKNTAQIEGAYRALGVDPTRIIGKDKRFEKYEGLGPGAKDTPATAPAAGGKGIKLPDLKQDTRVPSKTSGNVEFGGAGAVRTPEPVKKDDKKPERKATIERT